MRVLRFLSYPGFLLFAISAGYVLMRGPATGRRELLSVLLGTAFGVGELIVSTTALAGGSTLRRVGPRLLNAAGALTMAASSFVGREAVVLSVGSLILTGGLIWWTRQLRESGTHDA